MGPNSAIFIVFLVAPPIDQGSFISLCNLKHNEYRGSYISAHVLLNLLNELGKRNKMRGLPSILSLFCNKFNKFNKIQEHKC